MIDMQGTVGIIKAARQVLLTPAGPNHPRVPNKEVTHMAEHNVTELSVARVVRRSPVHMASLIPERRSL